MAAARGSDPKHGTNLHGGSFLGKHPEIPSGQVEPPPSSFSSQRDAASIGRGAFAEGVNADADDLLMRAHV